MQEYKDQVTVNWQSMTEAEIKTFNKTLMFRIFCYPNFFQMVPVSWLHTCRV